MTRAQTNKLIEALEQRKAQLISQCYTKHVRYKIHSGHHLRDIITTLAVLRGDKEADKLLINMPNED